jgi:beta-lactam-binding protein with PASTA domain
MVAQRWWAVGLAGFLLVACGASGPAGPKPTVTVTSVTTVTATQSPAPSKLTPPPSTQNGVVPNVVGLNHQLAQDTMQAAGFYFLTEEDATGQGRALLNDRNWVVVSQSPAPGTHAPPETKITLRSKKIGE